MRLMDYSNEKIFCVQYIPGSRRTIRIYSYVRTNYRYELYVLCLLIERTIRLVPTYQVVGT